MTKEELLKDRAKKLKRITVTFAHIEEVKRKNIEELEKKEALKKKK